MVAPEPSAASPTVREGAQDVVADRARLLVIGMASVFGASAVFAALRLMVQVTSGLATPWWGNAGGAVAVALVYAWVRRDPLPRSSLAVHLSALIATITMVIPAAYGMTSSKWWLALVGFCVLLLGRRREAIVWSVITIVILPTVALLESEYTLPNAIGEPPLERAISGLAFVVLLLAITAAFRRVAQRRARELTETAASLARANAVKSRFLAHMSHEIRTPLHGVIAMTDMALEGEASPIVKERIDGAQQSARVLLGLLNNVLDVARAESDALEIERRPFLLHSALSEVLRPLAAQARAKGLEFVARADPGIAELRVGDRVRITQLLLNLAGNALKFTRTGSIHVRLRAAADSADRLVLEVADTGRGIAADKVGAIFEPFTQAHAADAYAHGGAGLGLAIVRELVQRMEGSVEVQSVVDRGSTFRIELSLPRGARNGVGAEDLLPALPVSLTQPIERGRRSLSVLVCEDDPINRAVLLAMLKRLGHEARVAEDGLAAWSLLEAQERFDLLLTDVEVPGIDGMELTRRVRGRERDDRAPRLPIIGATAHVGEAEQHRLLDVGMDAHLPKPFTLGDLSRVIARVVPPQTPFAST